MGRQIYTAEQFRAAIPGSGGLFSAIAKRIGCDRHTAETRITAAPTLKRLYDDECALILDIGEQELIKAVRAGEGWAIKFYLSTKGKHRGYVERQEVRQVDDADIDAEIERELARVAAKRQSANVGAAEVPDP